MRPGLPRRIPPLVLLGLVPALMISTPWAAKPGDGPAPGQEQQERVARGGRLYAASCAVCHGARAEGTPQGPPLVRVGSASMHFNLSSGRMPIEDPDEQPRRKPPAFTSEQIADLILFVQTFGPGGVEIPVVNPEEGRLQRGREVFAANCMACHGPGGQGSSVGGGQVAPPIAPATTVQVAEAVRVGPGAMPPFGEDILPQEDLDSLLAYTEHLAEVENPGGYELGRVGPVAEGAIAVLFGLGLLVVVVRLTGTRG